MESVGPPIPMSSVLDCGMADFRGVGGQVPPGGGAGVWHRGSVDPPEAMRSRRLVSLRSCTCRHGTPSPPRCVFRSHAKRCLRFLRRRQTWNGSPHRNSDSRLLPHQPLHLVEGTLIDYRLRLFGILLRWQSQIISWDPPRTFVDVQRRGPYTRWIHTHHFREDDGGTIIDDAVEYSLPYWPLGELVSPLVRRQLHRIFRYRQQAIRAYFGERAREEPPYT